MFPHHGKTIDNSQNPQMQPNLTLRQKRIFDAITPCKTLADVGCDHGYIGGAALLEKVVQNVHFCDISAKSLQKAKILCQTLGFDQTQVDFFCQDGIGELQCDTAVIAGMGGLETIKILQHARHLPNTLILQPMRNQFDLRSFLCHNYTIETDTKFFDKKFYDLIVATKSKGSTLTELQLTFGKTNLTHPTADFLRFVEIEVKKCTAILKNCNSAEISHKLQLLNTIVDKN